MDDAPEAIPTPPPPHVMSVDQAERYRRQRLKIKWLSRAIVAAAFGLLLLAVHIFSPSETDARMTGLAMLGLLIGLASADFRIVRSKEVEDLNDVVSNDLARLEQCFTILQKQVTVTIKTSEHAVLELVERLHRSL